MEGRDSGRVSKPLVDGTRRIIVSPCQKFEQTMSFQRQQAWSMFRYVVHDKDIPTLKAEGYSAVKCRVTIIQDPRE